MQISFVSHFVTTVGGYSECDENDPTANYSLISLLHRTTTLCLKNAPALASCRPSFDKHGQILIFVGTLLKNDMHLQFVLSHQFYVLYLLLNSCDGNDAFWRHTMLVKQFSSFSRKHRISPDLCPPNSPVDYRICGLMQERVYIVQTRVRDTSRDQRLEAAPCWHMDKHITKRNRQSS